MGYIISSNITNSNSQALNQCQDLSSAYGVIINGRQVGIFLFMLFFLYNFTSFALVYFIYRQKRIAEYESLMVENTNNVKNVIFPVYLKLLKFNVVSNAYQSLIILFLSIAPFNVDVSRGSVVAYAIMWSMQHAIVEGVAFLLMQKGVGNYAAYTSFKWLCIWVPFTFLCKCLSFYFSYSKHSSANGYAVEMVWSTIQLLFYFCLAFAPKRLIFRRPAAVPYAKFWFLYRLLYILAVTVYYVEVLILNRRGLPYGYCIDMMSFIVVYAVCEPLAVYFTLLSDCRWWTGAHVNVGGDDKDISAPLEGINLPLYAAQQLAESVDKVGYSNNYTSSSSGNVNLLNFSFIKMNTNKLLGSGSSSKVYAGTYKKHECAIKLLFTADLTPEEVHRIWREARILSNLQHPNIVSLYGVSVLPPSVCIVLEYCTYGSLADIIKGNSLFGTHASVRIRSSSQSRRELDQNAHSIRLSRIDRLYLALGCARGLAALHSLTNMCHRDIKSFNFLVDSQFNAKLADLELGTKAKNGMKDNDIRISNAINVIESAYDNTSAYLSNCFCNNRYLKRIKSKHRKSWKYDRELELDEILANWTAPEVLKTGEFSKESDIYSLGLVLWEILSGTPPHASITKQAEIRELVGNGHRPDIPEDFLKGHAEWTEYVELMKQAWDQEPEKRPKCQDLLNKLEIIWRQQSISTVSGLRTDVKVKSLDMTDARIQFKRKSVSFANIPSSKPIDISAMIADNASLFEELYGHIKADPIYRQLDVDNASPWVVVLPEPPFLIVRANGAFCDMLGQQAEQLLGKSFSTFMTGPRTSADTMREFIAQMVAITHNNEDTSKQNIVDSKLYFYNQRTNLVRNSKETKEASTRRLNASVYTDDNDNGKICLTAHCVVDLYKEEDLCSCFSLSAFPIHQKTANPPVASSSCVPSLSVSAIVTGIADAFDSSSSDSTSIDSCSTATATASTGTGTGTGTDIPFMNSKIKRLNDKPVLKHPVLYLVINFSELFKVDMYPSHARDSSFSVQSLVDRISFAKRSTSAQEESTGSHADDATRNVMVHDVELANVNNV